MTANRRIVFNILATYGRSLFSLACGLFTARWGLMALGQVDYGLYGVIAGLTGFVAFINTMLSWAIERFYLLAVGQASVEEKGLEECHRWFSIAVMVHSVVPFVLIALGYPIGIWAIKNFLTIPPDRVGACVWVFRFVCLNCFVGMASVPYNSMYGAKQLIAELTVYSVVQTACTVAFMYFLVTHPGDHLVLYGAVMCVLSVLPQLLIALRASRTFPECKFSLRYCFDKGRLKELCRFSGLQLIGAVAEVVRSQGLAVVINKFHGPRINASMGIAGTVNSHATTLSGAMLGAFAPAIGNAWGARDFNRARSLIYKACKFSPLLDLVFLIPLGLELPYIMKLWLKDPPDYVCGLCMCMLVGCVIKKLAAGIEIAIIVNGKMALYQVVVNFISLMVVPLVVVCAFLGYSVYSIVICGVSTVALRVMAQVVFAHYLIGYSIRYWLFRIVMPIFVLSTLAVLAGYSSRFIMDASFLRVVCTTLVADLLLIMVGWGLLLDGLDRTYVVMRMRMFLLRFCHKQG